MGGAAGRSGLSFGEIKVKCRRSGYFQLSFPFFFPPVSLIQLTWRPLARHANVALPSNVTWPQGIGGQQGKCSLGHIHGQRYSAGSLLNTLTHSPGDKLGKI